MLEQYKVPMFLKESTEDRLVSAMLAHNIKHGACVTYTNIGKQGKYWYAWYLGNASKLAEKKIEVRPNDAPQDS